MTQTKTTRVGGAKVTVTPSEHLIAAAAQETTVTDAMGRVLRLKKPGVLAQFRLVEALGETARNEVYMGMVLPLIFVVGIDDEPVTMPASKAEVEALIKRLDEEGVQAAMIAVQKHFGATDEADAKNG